MFATATDVVKNFACGELFSFLYFNFVYDSIHYLCANCNKYCNKNFGTPFGTAGFRYSYISISTIFSPTIFIPTYATARDCTIYAYMNLQGVSKRFETPRRSEKKIPRYARILSLAPPLTKYIPFDKILHKSLPILSHQII